MDRIEQIKKRIEQLDSDIKKKSDAWDYDKTYDAWMRHVQKEMNEIAKLDRERRLIMPYELTPIPTKHCHVMTLKDFVKTVKYGGFIDSDGSGNYARDGQESDVSIYPSDVEFRSLRTDFDMVVWYNK